MKGRFVLGTVLLIFCANMGAVRAAEKSRLQDSTSPNQRYTLRVDFQKKGTPALYYVFGDRRTGVEIGRLASSYQPDDISDSWALRRALETKVYWRDDSAYVALEEASWHGIGTVFLLRRVGKVFQPIPLDEEAILPATQVAWSRHRLLWLNWGPRQRAMMEVAGSYLADYQHFEVTLDLANATKVKVISCRRL